MAWWVGTVNEEKEFLEPIWISRAKENLGEIPETQDELVRELRKLVDDEDGLKVPDDKKFYLMFLRSGMMIPRQGFEVMKNYFLFKKDNSRYFKVLDSFHAMPALTKDAFRAQQNWND